MKTIKKIHKVKEKRIVNKVNKKYWKNSFDVLKKKSINMQDNENPKNREKNNGRRNLWMNRYKKCEKIVKNRKNA